MKTIQKFIDLEEYSKAIDLFLASEDLPFKTDWERCYFLGTLYFLNQQFSDYLKLMLPLLSQLPFNQCESATNCCIQSFISILKQSNTAQLRASAFDFIKNNIENISDRYTMLQLLAIIHNFHCFNPYHFQCFLHKDLNHIFFLHAKASSSSIKKWFFSYHIQKDESLNIIYQRLNQEFHHINLKNSYLSPSTNQLLDPILSKITFVRNPWSRLVSVFSYFFIHSKNAPLFGDWQRHVHAIIEFTKSKIAKPFFTFRDLVNILYDAKKNLSHYSFLLGNTHYMPQAYTFSTINYDQIYDYSDASLVISRLNKKLNFTYESSTHLHHVNKSSNATKLVADLYPDEFNLDGIPNYKYFYDDDLIEKVAFIYSEDIALFNFTFNSGYLK